ncbi:MAG: AcrR family transcriptional regulator [Hyphomicrobiaceae bacterium]|jgi:AcrR family transcriptional regulator
MPEPLPLVPGARRTQAERRATTRALLLDSTLASLVEDGYRGATTTAVCKRAGLSQGALFAHFASKAELVAAAVSELFAHLIADFRNALGGAAQDQDPTRAAIDALWTVFRSDRIAAAFEIYVAARTDAGLARALAPVAEAHHTNILTEAQRLFGANERSDRREFDATVDLVIDALQGAALASSARIAPTSVEPLLARLTAIVRATGQPTETTNIGDPLLGDDHV